MVPYYLSSRLQVADIDEMSGDGGGGGHGRTDEVRATTATLASLEVAVAGGGAAFPFGEAIAVHGNAHTATRLTPLEAGLAEGIGQALLFGDTAHTHRAGNDQRAHIGRDVLALHVPGGHAQILQARIGAGADEDGVQFDVGDLLTGLQAHVLQGALVALALQWITHSGGIGDGAIDVGDHARIDAPRDLRTQAVDVDLMYGVELRAGIAGELTPGRDGLIEELTLRRVGTALDIGEGRLVGRDHASTRTGLNGHVAQRHASLHREIAHG